MKKLLFSAVMIAAMMGVVMSSCKKEESAQMKECVAQTEQSMSIEEQKVLDFLADYDAMKQGGKTEGEAVTPEQARWQWETTLNYCHGYPLSYLSSLRVDTVSIAMPKADLEGNIAYEDYLVTYGKIVDAVRETYEAIDIEDKTLQFVMMSLDDNMAKAGDSVRVVLNTGSRTTDPIIPDPVPSDWYGIPFFEDECYIWGLVEDEDDATDRLELHVSNYDYNHTIASEPYYFIVDPYRYATYQGGIDDWLFSVSGITENEADNYYLCWEYLNWEFGQIMEHTHTPYMEIRPYGHDGYFRTLVYGKERCLNPEASLKLFWISHVVEVYYATIQPIINMNYPTPIDE